MNLDTFDGKHKHVTYSEYTIYTDGSKIDKKVGSWAVIYHQYKIIATILNKLPDTATVFHAELKGIKTDNPDHKPKYVKICL